MNALSLAPIQFVVKIRLIQSYFLASSDEGLRSPPIADAAEPFGPSSHFVAIS